MQSPTRTGSTSATTSRPHVAFPVASAGTAAVRPPATNALSTSAVAGVQVLNLDTPSPIPTWNGGGNRDETQDEGPTAAPDVSVLSQTDPKPWGSGGKVSGPTAAANAAPARPPPLQPPPTLHMTPAQAGPAQAASANMGAPARPLQASTTVNMIPRAVIAAFGLPRPPLPKPATAKPAQTSTIPSAGSSSSSTGMAAVGSSTTSASTTIARMASEANAVSPPTVGTPSASAPSSSAAGAENWTLTTGMTEDQLRQRYMPLLADARAILDAAGGGPVPISDSVMTFARLHTTQSARFRSINKWCFATAGATSEMHKRAISNLIFERHFRGG
ncbi:hypothetical protein HK101_008850 [Irineochytrium annulatum]|nr:hypothetical protein HK101_008850 [Irineochytrium annulatum]